jgi:hypothetical protein
MNPLIKNAMMQVVQQLGPKLYEAYELGYDAGKSGREKINKKEFIDEFNQCTVEKVGK